MKPKLSIINYDNLQNPSATTLKNVFLILRDKKNEQRKLRQTSLMTENEDKTVGYKKNCPI